VRLQHENQLLKMQSSSDENSQLLQSMLDDANAHKHELECQVRYAVSCQPVTNCLLLLLTCKYIFLTSPFDCRRNYSSNFLTNSDYSLSLNYMCDIASCICAKI